MQIIRTLQRSSLGQRRGILRCLRWYTQIGSTIVREKIGRLGLATSPKRPIFFLISFDKICICHLKELKIPRRRGTITSRNVSEKNLYLRKSMKL